MSTITVTFSAMDGIIELWRNGDLYTKMMRERILGREISWKGAEEESGNQIKKNDVRTSLELGNTIALFTLCVCMCWL